MDKQFLPMNIHNKLNFTTMNKRNALALISALLVLVITSCSKDDDGSSSKLTSEEITSYSAAATVIYTDMQMFMSSSLYVAADSGYSFTMPEIDTKSAKAALKSKSSTPSWIGPDANGWYYWTYNTDIYDYSQKLRKRGDTVDYVYSIKGGSEYSYVTTVQYVPYIKNDKKLFKGFSKIEVNTFGYSNISSTKWEMDFQDWNPETYAGIFDWYYGVSVNSGGETVPYHKIENLIAVESPRSEGWLDCHITIYAENSQKVCEFDYSIPWEPVDMPDTPDVE
jgi:hypothetical protein